MYEKTNTTFVQADESKEKHAHQVRTCLNSSSNVAPSRAPMIKHHTSMCYIEDHSFPLFAGTVVSRSRVKKHIKRCYRPSESKETHTRHAATYLHNRSNIAPLRAPRRPRRLHRLLRIFAPPRD